jgi:hypothetical protein
MKPLYVLLLVSGLSTAACGGAGMRSYQPVEEQTRFDSDQLFGAAQRSFDKLGYMPTNLDRSAHTLSTREKEVGYSSVPRLSYKYAFTVETAGGRLHIVAHCTMNSSINREKFEDCGDDRPQLVLDEMAKLKEKILEVAKSVPAGPKFDEPGEDEAAEAASEEPSAPVPGDKTAGKK